jgi:hypothetical protein
MLRCRALMCLIRSAWLFTQMGMMQYGQRTPLGMNSTTPLILRSPGESRTPILLILSQAPLPVGPRDRDTAATRVDDYPIQPRRIGLGGGTEVP